MIAAPVLRWILTLLLVALTVYAVGRVLRAPGGKERFAHLFHSVMATAMTAMCWPWGMELPHEPQMVVFVVATCWFLGSATWAWRTGAPKPRTMADLSHASVMAAMAWMLHAMGTASHGGSPSHSAGHGASGAHHHGGDSGSTLTTMSLLDPSAQGIAAAFSIVALLSGLWWLARAFDQARVPAESPANDARVRPFSTGAGDLFCHAVMGVVMALMLVLMV